MAGPGGALTDSTNHLNHGRKEERHPPPGSDKENAPPLQQQCGGRSSLQLCMQMNNEPPLGCSDHSAQLKIWDFSDSEAAPASSWSVLPSRALLCRPLPFDVGRCTCAILKEPAPQGVAGGSLYSLHTNEGHGRQNRKLAVALHKRHHGKSEFKIAQNLKGLMSRSDDNFIGIVTANFVGSEYLVWDQGGHASSSTKHSDALVSVVRFMPTIATWTGSHRGMRVHVPKHQLVQLKTTTQVFLSSCLNASLVSFAYLKKYVSGDFVTYCCLIFQLMQRIKGLPKEWRVLWTAEARVL